jgi:hypothetical protein
VRNIVAIDRILEHDGVKVFPVGFESQEAGEAGDLG